MSLKPTPGSGKSGTSRTRVVRSMATRGRLVHQSADVAAEEQVRKLLGALREVLQIAEGRLPPLCIPRPQRGRDHCLEQPTLAIGGRAEGAEVACADSESRERLARRGDVRVALGVDAMPFLDPRLEQSEVLELSRPIGRDASALAEL
jgi:hypothetical protein